MRAEGSLLRGMPSTNQHARGKEGLNEANDPTAITAERSALNIGILVWNECKGMGRWGGWGAVAARARRVFLPDNWSSSSSNSIVVIHVFSPCEGSGFEKWALVKYDKAVSQQRLSLSFSFSFRDNCAAVHLHYGVTGSGFNHLTFDMHSLRPWPMISL